MEAWQTIILALGGNVVLLAVLGWLSKSLLSQLLAKDMESYKMALKSESDLAIQKLKYDIDKSIIEYKLKQSKLHEKRADVIADTYGLLVQCYREVSNLIYPSEIGEMPEVNDSYKSALNSVNEFFIKFNMNRIYLPEDPCLKIDKFIMELRSHAIMYYESIVRDERLSRQSNQDERLRKRIYESVERSREFIDNESKAIKAILEKELRKLTEEVK